jgi:hypothetical protein
MISSKRQFLPTTASYSREAAATKEGLTTFGKPSEAPTAASLPPPWMLQSLGQVLSGFFNSAAIWQKPSAKLPLS